MYSAINYTTCLESDINATIASYGVITSDGYPNFIPNQTCRRKIVASVGKFIRVFVTDLSIEQPEPNGM